MKVKVRDILYSLTIIPLLALCQFTGGAESPARYFYYPLAMLLSLHVSPTILLQAGFTFIILHLLMVYQSTSSDMGQARLMVEIIAFSAATFAAGFLARSLRTEREQSENVTATFHGLSEDLKHRTMNLQTALDALSEAHTRLQDTSREKTRFLANVSHELRTPLTSIRSYSEILLNYDDIDNETRREFMKVINGESERLSLLVNEYLDLMKIESGKLELNLVPVNLAELVTRSLQVVMPQANEKNIPIITDMPENLPYIRGDMNQLTQVLVNLLNNAIKFTMEGEITVGARVKENTMEFFVTDTGEGIFPEEKGLIFEEYYRISDGVPVRPKGSGLGLSICKKIVEYHGGKVWVDSEPGKGSTFFFTVPLVTAEPAAPPDYTFPRGADAPKEYGPVLVINESVATRQSLRKRLEQFGYQTLGADTPARALEIARAMSPGLIITDVMKQHDEYTKLETWARGIDIQVIMVSLYISRQDNELHLAFHGYFAKPFDKNEIIAALQQLHNHTGRIAIISPDQQEARNLQVLLGGEGFRVDIYREIDEATRTVHHPAPDGIILGSFPAIKLDGIITAIKETPGMQRIPLFLVLGYQYGKRARKITIGNGISSGQGLFPLIMEVEKAYVRKWGQLKPAKE